MRYCAIIPALQAGKTIAQVVTSARVHCDEVIVVDDGSSDETFDVACRAGAVAFQHEVNRGKGEALRRGFQYATSRAFDACFTLDADGQHLASEMPKLRAAMNRTSADIIIGSRAHQLTEMRGHRIFSNRSSSAIISWLTGQSVNDSQSGFRLIKTAVWNAALPHGDRYEAETELLIKASRKGYKIHCEPVDSGRLDGVSTTHYRLIPDTWRILKVMVNGLLLWR